ncbi:PKD domain-containing protein [Haliscomenobacter hydrossis]|uniref:PKD domain containing protein n=1 Tax=Haliscomenobacter hydrossis (strain ATCC 27775 / DSM 1100 / LMG 10767 / O) TaxID=760192 RepID=F4KUF7_HALH1|nr:PKD domain-containing protein [Haliscomenobacter hydrossis]AEE51239.1 PKD domain containing protein [Haliscomenobacter hydrossis DSM 1100]
MKKTTTRLLMLSLCLLLSQLLWSQNQGVKVNNGKLITISQALNTSKTGDKVVTLRASSGDKFRWNTGESTQAIEVPYSSKERYTVDIEEKDGRRTSLTTSLSSDVLPRKVTKPGSAQLSAPDPQPGCPSSSLTGSYSRICAGTTLQLSANGGTSYLWSTGQTSSSIQVTPTENINYTVTITFSDPEESLFCQDIKSTGLIEVIEQPTAVINGGGGNLCGGGAAVLTAGGGDTYLWNTGATSATITVSPASTSLYSVTATKAGLCSDDASTTVNVTPFNPAISGLSTVCLGYGTQLTASGGTSYVWSNGFQSSSINVGPTSPGTYAYSVTITNGSCSAVRSHTLTVNPSPSASISGPAGACYNGSIALSASGGGTYSWSTGATTAGINVAALQNTQSFTVTVSNSYGCHSSESKTVSVYEPPSLDGTLSVCAGQAANLSVTGGSSYSWNTGETTASISPYPSSTSIYRVTVSDPNACTYVLSKTVSVSNLPNARISGPNTTCAGQNVSLTAFGGSSYLWSTGANTATINVSPGSTTTYTVTVSSSGGCVGSASQVISVHPLPLGNIAGASSVCPGQSTTLSASGGSTYLWNTGASSAAIEVSPTQNTNYTVSITNAQGCTLVKSHSVAVNITGSASNDGPLTCTKTTATLLGTSSAQGASYRWKNASGVEIATTPGTAVTTAGVYTLEITAAGGCTYTTATEVVQDLQIPQVSANSSGMLTCVQSSINLLGTSSASPASYEWRNGSGTLIANTLNASTTQTGTYTLQVTAANGCSNTASTTVTADLATPQVSVQHDGSLTCAKPSAILSASSSSSGLQYTWKDAAGNPLGTGSSIQVTNSGTYWLEAKGTNGCIVNQSIALTQSGTLPTVNVSLSTSGCHFTLQGSSTTAGVSYSWTNQNGRVVATTPSFTTNQASIYTLKVSTASGCSKQASINAGNSETTVSMSIGGVSQGYLTYHKTNLTCTKNSVVLSASSADVIDSYLWKSPSGAYLSYSSNLTVTQAGTYLLQAGTENGCPQIHEVLVERINTMPAAQISGDSTVCRYASTNLSIFVSGGTYQWSNGSSSFSINTGAVVNDVSFAVTVTLGSCQKIYPRTVRVEGQAPSGTGTAGPTQPCTHIPVTYSASGGSQYKWSSGETTSTVSVPNGFTSTSWVNYWVDISDQYGCSTRRSFTVKPKISPVVTVSGVPTAPFCEQALINLTATGGGTYLWSSGETTANLQKTLSASSSLNVKVTAANGCAITKPINIEVVPRPIPQILGGDIACAGGSTTLSATGGSTYLWSNNATTSSIALTQPTTTQAYSVTVSTQPGCSGVAQKTVIVPAALSLNYTLANLEDCTANNASVQPIVTGGQGNISLSIARYGELYFSPSLNGLRSGTYVLKAEDNQQCIALKEVVIEEKQPAPAIDLPDVEVCAGATASLSINNAAAYTTFLWSNGATTSSIMVSPTTITTYTITATASNGCQAMDQVVVRVNPILTAIAEGSGTFCLPFGSSANATLFASVNGGTAPYTYQWYSGQTTASISVSTPASAGFGVVVTDSKGCTASASASVIVIPLPQAQITGGEINCYGNSTTLTATGGQSYLWSTGATTASIAVTPSSSTYYSVTVSNGTCAAVPTGKMVQVPAALSLSYQLQNDQDCTPNNTNIIPLPSNAQGAVGYVIAPQGTLDFSTNLQALGSGVYTLTALDANNCAASTTVNINEKLPPAPISLSNAEVCAGTPATLSVSGAPASGVSYSWTVPSGASNPGNIASFSTLIAGTYTVTMTDNEGCAVSATASVNVIPFPEVQITGGEINCYGLSTTLTATGGQAYLWSTGSTTTSIAINQPTQTATYTVTVTNGGVCSVVAEKIVLVPEVLSVSYALANDDDCILNNVIILPTSNAQGEVHYQLALQGSSDFSDDLQGKGSGNYTLKATDENGCEAILLFTINEVQSFLTLTYELDNPDDCIQGNAQLQVNAQNGHGPVEIRINPNGNPDTIFTVSSGTYAVFAIDSAGCQDSIVITVDEKLPSNAGYNLFNLDDCHPNNTMIIAKGNSARGEIKYKLDTGEVTADSIFNNVIPGYHSLFILDSLGCKDSILIVVPDESQIQYVHQDVSHCDTTDGNLLFFNLPFSPEITYQYSVDSGKTWLASRNFTTLSPGAHVPSIKKLPANCIVYGDTLLLGDTCRLYPLAGFTKDTLLITSPEQLLRFPWKVETPKWFKDSFDLNVRLEGTGYPHFVENGQNANLRASQSFILHNYPSTFNGLDKDSIGMASTAGQDRYPVVYTFKLTPGPRNKVIIDPKHEQISVLVALGELTTYIEENIFICKGEEQTLDAGLGMCYNWSDGHTESPRVVQPNVTTDYYVTIIDQSGKVTVKHFTVNVMDFSVNIQLDHSDQVCKKNEFKLFAKVEGSNMNFTYNWNVSGVTPTEVIIIPELGDRTEPFSVTVTGTIGNKQCVQEDDISVEEVRAQLEDQICENIRTKLLSLGFIGYPIEVVETIPLQPKPEQRSTCEVIDRAQATINLGEQRYDLGIEMCNLVNSIKEKGYSSTGYITSNADFCGENWFETLYNQYSSNNEDYDVFFHVDNCKDGEAILFVKINPNYLLILSPDNPVMSNPQDVVAQEYIESLEDSSCKDCPDWVKEIWNDDYTPGQGAIFGYIAPAIPIFVVGDGGPLVPIGDIIIGMVAAIAISADLALQTHITYVAHNETKDTYYCGRTRGYGTRTEIKDRRIGGHHHVVKFKYTTWVDQALNGEIGRLCIRGREQQLIDFYGGALSDPEVRSQHVNPRCENLIRGVAKLNPMGYFYHWCSTIKFGEIYPYTGARLQDIEDFVRRNEDWIKKKFKF